MPKVKFLKDPGYLYDLFFLFVLRFNKEYCLKNYINQSNAEADIEYYEKLYDEIKDISEDLLPFFYMKESNKCFMTLFYFSDSPECVIDSLEACSFSTLQAALKNYEQITEQMIRFYFPNIGDDKVKECQRSFIEISRVISKSEYNAEVKSSLYHFFLYPEQIVQKLSYECSAAKQVLTREYERNLEKTLELYQQFELEAVASALSSSNRQAINFLSLDELYVSFCMCIKNCIKMCNYNNATLLLLGENYKAKLFDLQYQNQRPVLDVFGNVLSEPNRVELLDLIFQKGETTIREIEQILGMSGTNAYYHLSLMLRIGMVNVRNRGRTLLYSINKEYFSSVAAVIQRYSE